MARPLSSPVHELSDEEVLEAIALHGSINKAAQALDMPNGSFKRRVRAMKSDVYQEMQKPNKVAMETPHKGVRRWIFTSAQCNTAIDEAFLDNLEAYAKKMDATIHISGFTYNVNPFGKQKKKEPLQYHPRIRPYLTNDPFEIDGKLVFCGEMNTLPTAVNPLSGFATYTREKWGILPHPKFVLESIPVRMCDDPKIIMTTGAITKPNYVPRKAGIKAQFHHIIGAVVVELDETGDFFVRQLVADDDGSFFDLDLKVVDGKVETKQRARAITWGDIHVEHMDAEVFKGAWFSPDSICSVLNPEYQIFHDVLDFRRRNHHSINDPHHWYKMHVRGKTCVEQEVREACYFLRNTYRTDSKSVIIDSNHDRALERWLKEANPRFDPVNAEFYLNANTAYLKSIRDKEENFLLFEWACREVAGLPSSLNIEFVPDTQPFMIDDIEYGMHGHKGANGRRGHIRSFARMGPKANVAHTHHAAVFEGIYQAGHSCKRDVEYNRGGLTSWNQSHIVTYPNGKRTILTVRGKKWRA